MSNDVVVIAGQTTEQDIDIHKLVVLRRDVGGYQRNFNAKRAKQIADNFDWALWRKPEVAPIEDGKFAVIDGQTRVGALLIMANGNPMKVRCDVQRDVLSMAEQARRFISQFSAVKKLNPDEQFHSSRVAEDPDAMAYAAILDRYGFRTWKSGTAVRGYVSPVLYKWFIKQHGRDAGMEMLATVFEVATSAWGKEIRLYTEPARYIGMVLHAWQADEQFSMVRLINALGRTSQLDLKHAVQKTMIDRSLKEKPAVIVEVGSLYNHKLPAGKQMVVMLSNRAA